MIATHLLNLIETHLLVSDPSSALLKEIHTFGFYKKVGVDFSVNFGELKVVDLKNILRKFHCKLTGKKADLLKRVNELFDLRKAGYKKLIELADRYNENIILANSEHGLRHRLDIKTLIKKPVKPGFVYCIKFNDYVKIGMSCTKQEKLVGYLYKRYKTPYGFDFLTPANLKYKYYADVRKAEKQVHQELAAFKVNNSELFKFDFEKIILR